MIINILKIRNKILSKRLSNLKTMEDEDLKLWLAKLKRGVSIEWIQENIKIDIMKLI